MWNSTGMVTVWPGSTLCSEKQKHSVLMKNGAPMVGTATFNVTPIKGAPFFIKTECFCFSEQRVEPGQTVTMPVLFHIDPQIDEEERFADVKDFTLSYTFFPIEAEATTEASLVE